ncbi:IclR family transcriptional regulator [Sphingomonas sanguinis]|uniref:IclR family transcriptional regulator n=1 Tax=Sphingomonas sp. LC-1 TaxID=3110957 RepID=UPI0021BAAA14|nr:IclR family transcriptional regulator [Sphingomonas sp. LC-1]MCT8000732.1 IclR family transcriptional regulator [Sphingomonas sp. LC-1]
MSTDTVGTVDDKRLYRAPALEKGLDILELLSAEENPLTMSAIVNRLGRSTGELFRMIQVLEHRGYVTQGPDGYVMTSRLFHLGLKRPPVRSLMEQALPPMRLLADRIGQSCYLAIPSGSCSSVIARMEADTVVGVSVRVGYRRAMHETPSGILLYAFQPEATRREWEGLFDPPLSERALGQLREKADTLKRQGFAQSESGELLGMVELAAPIMRSTCACAVLTVPFVRIVDGLATQEEALAELRRIAGQISEQLVGDDLRI